MSERPKWTVRRSLERLLVAATAAGLAWAAWGWWHDRTLSDRFAAIALGMDRKGVEAALGGPDWEGGCAGWIAYLPREGCSRELGYSSAFAPLLPEHYLIQLDRTGRVIEAEPVRSR